MIKHLEVDGANVHDFNLDDTYLFVEGRYQRGRVTDALTRRGYKYRVLFTGQAINNYVIHRGEYVNTDPNRFRQTLVIIEIDELPKE